ncbi:MAG: DUF5685 family protein [Eubacteriales bacterium]|nr:DUF5685 family protein [Eubacteriales bacterium]
MFGYLRPYKDEMRLKDIRKYSTYYCALCNQIRKDYGFFWTAFLNYESVYTLLFLESFKEYPEKSLTLRCHLNPFMKKKLQINGDILAYSAFVNMALLDLKFEDNEYDGNKLPWRILKRILHGKKRYKEMSESHKGLLESLKDQADLLRRREKENSNLDSCADTTGNMLVEIIKYWLRDIETESEMYGTVVQLHFHVGKLIYTLDAYEDFESDISKNQFNPIVFISPEKGRLAALEKTRKIMLLLKFCIAQEIKKVEVAKNKEIIENILTFGIEHSLMKAEEKRTHVHRRSNEAI